MIVEGLLEMDDFFGTILHAMPLPVFVVDEDVKIIAANQAASRMLGKDPTMLYRRRAGEILHCVHSREVSGGCGKAPSCRDCIVRNSVAASFRDNKPVSQKVRMELVEEGKETKEIFLNVTAAPFEYRSEKLVLLILQDISELTDLKRILPMCAHCKKIRDDEQYWHSVEKYFKDHMNQDFSHGLCPECLKKLYPEFFNRLEED
jgi:PAS domain-containing protein